MDKEAMMKVVTVVVKAVAMAMLCRTSLLFVARSRKGAAFNDVVQPRQYRLSLQLPVDPVLQRSGTTTTVKCLVTSRSGIFRCKRSPVSDLPRSKIPQSSWSMGAAK